MQTIRELELKLKAKDEELQNLKSRNQASADIEMPTARNTEQSHDELSRCSSKSERSLKPSSEKLNRIQTDELIKKSSIMQNIPDHQTEKEDPRHGRPCTSTLDMQAAELSLQRHASQTPKNSPKKSIEQFNDSSPDIFNDKIAKENRN